MTPADSQPSPAAPAGPAASSTTTGRFTSLDPVRSADAPLLLNGYGYTADNPISGSDPTRAMPCMDGYCGGCNTFKPGGANDIRMRKDAASQADYAASYRVWYYCHWAPPALAHLRPQAEAQAHSQSQQPLFGL